MTPLPTAAALAVLVVLAGISGVVVADPTDVSPTATPTAVATDQPPERPSADAVPFERRLAARLSQFDLTEDQIETVVTEAVRLRDAGASRLVIRSSIVMNLYAFGVDAPFLYAGDDPTAGERVAERLGERFDLTSEQVAEIAATIDRLRAAGASRAEILRVVHALLVEYGVADDDARDDLRRVAHERALDHRERVRALHERAHWLHHVADTGGTSHAVDRLVDHLQDRHDLTDAQAAELERLVQAMLDDGASRDAIAEAVRERLAAWETDQPPVRRVAPAPERGADR